MAHQRVNHFDIDDKGVIGTAADIRSLLMSLVSFPSAVKRQYPDGQYDTHCERIADILVRRRDHEGIPLNPQNLRYVFVPVNDSPWTDLIESFQRRFEEYYPAAERRYSILCAARQIEGAIHTSTPLPGVLDSQIPRRPLDVI